MKKYSTPEISNNVFAVGARDLNRRVFDALIPTPRGTSFNSYLIKGTFMTALIDTVGPGFEFEFAEKLSQLIDLPKLDYIVMNHAEPDHGHAIGHIMKLTNATLITSEKGAAMAVRFHGAPAERIKTVKEGDTIDLGGKTLKFIDAPWLHWPETMFTYLIENKILFSCDFFGAHVAQGVFDNEVDDAIPFAKSYFSEIMMPLRNFGKKAMDKISTLPIEIIAPSHGPVYKNPSRILEPYRQWVNGETRQKAVLVYATMWNSTETIINALAESLGADGIEVRRYNLVNMGLDHLAEDLVDSRALVIGTPTVLSTMHPVVSYAANLIKALKPPIKYGAVVNSYGWGKGAVKSVLEFFENAKIEAVGSVEVCGPPLEDDYVHISELATQLAAKIKSE